MAQFAHGGDITSYGDVIDFSANINPLGMPPEVVSAAEAAVAGAVHYPDPFCRSARAAIAGRDGVSAGRIVCGNGAADLIFRLCLAMGRGRALVCAPTFSEYAAALRAMSWDVREHTLSREDGFEVGESYLESLSMGADIAFLCTPNNPTGRLLDPEIALRAADICRRQGTLLVIDECFLELSTPVRPLTELLGRGAVLLRAFTKSYAMPGLRFGYALCPDEATAEKIASCGQPWSVSCVAQAAAVAACSRPDWPAMARAVIEAARPGLVAGLKSAGLEVFDSAANFIMFRAAGDGTLRERLVEKGFLIRSCSNYPGLGDGYYRIAVRSERENALLIKAVKEAV